MNSSQFKIIVIAVGILLIGSLLYFYIDLQNNGNFETDFESYDLLNFNSYEEFNSYLQSSPDTDIFNTFETTVETPPRSDMVTSISVDEKSFNAEDGGDYSSTNIQELGVDEPDLVKTDGTYLYVISGGTVYIIYGYPADKAEIISTISFNESQSPMNLFVNDNRMTIIAQSYQYRLYEDDLEYDLIENMYVETKKSDETNDETSIPSSTDLSREEKPEVKYEYDIWTDTTTTLILLYDISTIEKPTMVKEIQMEGYYSTGRMIEDYIYVITTHYAYEPVLYGEEESGYIPKIKVDNVETSIELSDIYYIDSPDVSKTLINIVSFNLLDESADVTTEVFMLGHPSVIYVSPNAIYITSVNNYYQYSYINEILDEYVVPALPSEARNELNVVDSLTLDEYQKATVIEWIIMNYIETLDDNEKEEIARQIIQQYEKTTIHKITLNNGQITYEAQGSIPGSIKNQFSMSEFEGNLRVATTVQGWMMKSYVSSIEPYNTVYVLNETLDVIGKIETIAEGEEIYAVRFTEEVCYLVTYKQIDPFFVIDLQNPRSPAILGELKIPGYSTYLHPYDEQHIIGIGMENNTIKISLFDVVDVSNPEELATYLIDDVTEEYYWMYSTALYEHKAFLFEKDKNLLIIPVSSDYIESAYVFNISLDAIELRGIISHSSGLEESDLESSELYEPWDSTYWKGDYRYSIKRSLYIEDVIYTISDAMILLNDMDTLDEINKIDLS